MTAGTAQPHARWFLRDRADRLAASYAAALAAIGALKVAAGAHRGRAHLRPQRQRIAGRRGWPRTAWLILVVTATAVFLGWVSARLGAHLTGMPVAVAVLPGVILTAALASAAGHAAGSLERPPRTGHDGFLPPLLPLAAAGSGVFAWVTLWLLLTTGTPVWATLGLAVALTIAAAVAMVTCCAPEGPRAGSALPGGDATRTRCPPSLRLRARHKRAHRLLDAHTRKWTEATHQYAVAIADSDQPERALAGLLAGEADFSPDGISSYDLIILSALRNYHPAPLAASLDTVARHLADDGPAESAAHLPAAIEAPAQGGHPG